MKKQSEKKREKSFTIYKQNRPLDVKQFLISCFVFPHGKIRFCLLGFFSTIEEDGIFFCWFVCSVMVID